MALRALPDPEPLEAQEPTAPSGTDYSCFDSDSLGRCVDTLHGISNAAVAEIFAIVCELDRRGDFAAHGAKDAASWLLLRLGISYATAARWAEVALGLKDLPHLRRAFASGRLSLDKLPAAIALATPETDSWVAEEAVRLSIRALQVAGRRRRAVTAEHEKEARRRRRVWWSWTNDGTVLLLGARLTAEQGRDRVQAVVRLPPQGPGRGRARQAARGRPHDAPRAEVDAPRPAGERRHLLFPGCDRTDFLVPHHKAEWDRHRGPTDPDNLPLLCPSHHPLPHHADRRVEGSPSEGLVFVGPKGRVRDGPPPLDYDVKKWLWEELYRPSSELLFDTS